MGNDLREVQRDELWREGDHLGFDDWLATTGVTGRTTAYKAMRVAGVFAEEMAARFGTEKLVAGLSYLSATRKNEKAGDLLAVRVRVRDEAGAWTSVPFVDASAAEIRTATSGLTESRRQRALPVELRNRVARLNRQVARSAGGYRSARARVHRTKAGRMMVSLASVPFDEFDAYVAEVRAGLMVGEGTGEGTGEDEAG